MPQFDNAATTLSVQRKNIIQKRIQVHRPLFFKKNSKKGFLFVKLMSQQKLLLETTERFKTLIALTLEQCNTILDTFLQQVQAIQVGQAAALPAPPAPVHRERGAREDIEEHVVAQASDDFSSAASPFAQINQDPFDYSSSAPSSVVAVAAATGDSFIDDDQADMVVGSDHEFDDDEEEEEEEEEEELEEEESIRAKAPKPKVVLKRSQRNRKRTRLFDFEDFPNQDKDVEDEIDLYDDKKGSSDSSSAPSAFGGREDYDLEDFRYFLTRISARGKRTSLVQVMEASPFSRTRFAHPLDGIRQGLGHDGARSRNARRLFDTLLNNGDSESIFISSLNAPKRSSCALCGTTRICVAALHVDQKVHELASKCLHIAEAVLPFSKKLVQLSKDADKATRDDLKMIDKLFEKIMQAHANKNE
ncbi:MAG: hypothetical protein K2Q45_09055 [Nitrosomonas sp.]|nr:hypothetical protein [Nitrosomonas sp.]